MTTMQIATIGLELGSRGAERVGEYMILDTGHGSCVKVWVFDDGNGYGFKVFADGYKRYECGYNIEEFSISLFRERLEQMVRMAKSYTE